MPDQSSASEEHALIQEIATPLANLPDDPVPEVSDVEFPIVLRGYDRLAVDAYVARTSQLVGELSAGRSPQAAVRRALERVGEEVSGILQRAHETAEEVTARSRAEAEDRVEAARREAEALLADARRQAEATVGGAHHRLTELDAETDRIWAERHQIVEDTRSLAAQLLSLAEAAVERFPAADERTRTDEHLLEHDVHHEEDADDPDTGEVPEADEADTGEVTQAFHDDEDLTRPFDIEAETPRPGSDEAAQNTMPLETVEPPDGDTDELLEHDAE